MKQDPSVKNLIFDLGGVILDLSVNHTLQAFSVATGLSADKVKETFFSSPGFEAYEKGELTDAEFRDFIRDVYAVNISDYQIDECWNAMLLGIPRAKLTLLTQLKQTYQVYLLSNTNGIHLDFINSVMMPTLGENEMLDTYFHRAYYSHLMKKRKPDAEIFEQVLNENGLMPNESFFMDDNESNIAGAKALGIKTLHIHTPDLILNYFHA